MKPIVRADNLGKLYQIGTIEAPYGSLRETLSNFASSSWARLKAGRNGASSLSTIWALRDLSFTVYPGEAVAIVGRNGAGKSTLLKLISRITEPTTGRIELYGRIGSLLEVGTGFHPELTGRENIFLNGAIIGMRKAEIKRKFDEIVAFAEVERFIDTPVKRYSSGMYMRLAFAVAAHLEPEILLVDEVLAVGDFAFQKKCLGKMGEVAQEGRTVLFVSHNMVAVQSLCQRAIWLDKGQMVEEGSATGVVTKYLREALKGLGSVEEEWDDISAAPGNESVRLRKVSVRPEKGSPSDPLTMQTPFAIEIEYWNLLPNAQLHVTLHLYTEQEVIAFTTGSTSDPNWESEISAGLFRSTCYIPANLLNAGVHRFEILVVKDRSFVIFQHKSKVAFEIVDLRQREGWFGREPGVVQPILNWRTERLDCGV